MAYALIIFIGYPVYDHVAIFLSLSQMAKPIGSLGLEPFWLENSFFRITS
jgi:hypothetical protein